MPAIVQINFDFTESRTELEESSLKVSSKFSDVEGLRWKVWLVDDSRKRAGGIYLFETRKQAEAYAAGGLVAHLKTQRQHVEIRIFDTIDDAGKATRAPV